MLPDYALGMLNAKYGYVEGAQLALALPKAATHIIGGSDSKDWFISISSFSRLTDQQKQETNALLSESGQLASYQNALSVLMKFYPECPMNFLFDQTNTLSELQSEDLRDFKLLLLQLFYRRGIEATFAQANALYIAFVTDKFKVMENLSLAEFPKIEDYPNTEISKRIASSVRATINLIFGMDVLTMTDWSKYFWNRGLELEPCNFEWASNDE
jgi:hypothetical protein